jgi:hypothetical protein
MKQLLVATILFLSLTGCNQAAQEQAAREEPAQPADVPLTGDSTLLDKENTVVELADSVPHLD